MPSSKGIARTVEDVVRSILEDIAFNAAGPKAFKAFKPVVELVLGDVVRDVLDAGRSGLWVTKDFVRLAFWRALCRKLGIKEEE